MAVMASPSASLAQPALRGRFGSFCSCSPLFRISGFKQVQQNCLRITGIRCKHKRSSSENTEPISSAEEKSSRQRSRKRQLKYQSLASYRSRFTLALQAELNAEQEMIKERLKKWPKQKLEEEGVALFDLYVQHEGSLYRDKLLKFYTRLGDGMLPSHNQFGQGDIVVMSRNHPLAEDESIVEGVVVERARRFVKLAVPFSQFNVISIHGKWRLDLYANRVAYERCMFAVDIFSSPFVQQHAGICHVEITEKMRKSVFGWPLEDQFKFGEGASTIRGLLMKFQELGIYSSFKEEENASEDEEKICTSNIPWATKLLEELKAMKSSPSRLGAKNVGNAKNQVRTYLQSLGGKLNASQKAAIETAALQRVTLWQGPPGTGKTKTLTHLVAALCERRERVLACADRICSKTSYWIQ